MLKKTHSRHIDDPTRNKINSEINQLQNQRFVICTFALTIFSVVSSWILPNGALSVNITMESYRCILPSLLLFLLFLLFIWTRQIAVTISIISCYLIIRESSEYEVDLRKYFNEFPCTITLGKMQSLIFMFLGIATIFITLLTAWQYKFQFESNMSVVVFIIFSIIYILSVPLIAFNYLLQDQKIYKERWQKVLEA